VIVARSAIQFQDGLSLSGFLKRYGTEEQCEAAVRRWRWPGGPKCGGREHGIVGTRQLYECHAWFQAMWFITQSRGSISTLELSRQGG
jgi:Transposase zinc-ribbon domain